MQRDRILVSIWNFSEFYKPEVLPCLYVYLSVQTRQGTFCTSVRFFFPISFVNYLDASIRRHQVYESTKWHRWRKSPVYLSVYDISIHPYFDEITISLKYCGLLEFSLVKDEPRPVVKKI